MEVARGSSVEFTFATPIVVDVGRPKDPKFEEIATTRGETRSGKAARERRGLFEAFGASMVSNFGEIVDGRHLERLRQAAEPRQIESCQHERQPDRQPEQARHEYNCADQKGCETLTW